MGSYWFSQGEVREMTTPVSKRIIKTILRRRRDEAVALCGLLREERILLHDLFVDACTALYTWIGENLGEEQLEDMFNFSFQQSCQRSYHEFLDLDMERGLEASLVARASWVAHSCSGAGEHGGAFSLVEDDEKFTFVLDPCGSGGREWRRGMYEPPYSFGLTSRAYPWSYNRKDFPYYCCHCPFNAELLTYEKAGFLNWPVDPPEHAMDVCRWHLYKDKYAVPDEYHERFGLQRKRKPRQDLVYEKRWFSDERLQEMVKPTPDRIRERLERGEFLSALWATYYMKSEFFYLHNLYVSMLATALDYIARNAGEERMGEALSYVYDKCVVRQIIPLTEGLSRKEIVEFMVFNFFLAGTCGGAGIPAARIAISEDESKVDIILDPCPSGGKLLRRHAYETLRRTTMMREKVENGLMKAAVKLPLPRTMVETALPIAFDYISETRRPEGLGTTSRGYAWTGGIAGLPYYCSMCTSFVRESGCEWLEVIPPGDKREPCIWRIRK